MKSVLAPSVRTFVVAVCWCKSVVRSERKLLLETLDHVTLFTVHSSQRVVRRKEVKASHLLLWLSRGNESLEYLDYLQHSEQKYFTVIITRIRSDTSQFIRQLDKDFLMNNCDSVKVKALSPYLSKFSVKLFEVVGTRIIQNYTFLKSSEYVEN